ncbi:MAG: flavodoxin family protein [Desulfomonilaceae bacterium]
MNILVVNGSPRGRHGNTYLLQEAFVMGAVSAGAHVEEVFLNKRKIKPCLGCLHCWLKTPGVCIQKDDQAALLEMCKQTDVFVLATPVYVDGMTGQTKIFLDRLVPLAKPEFILVDNHCRHPVSNHRKWKFVLISNCGFHEMDNFDALVLHCRKMCLNFGSEYAGHLLRPHGPLLAYRDAFSEAVGKVLEAAQKAGEELVRSGVLSAETSSQVSQEIVSQTDYMQMVNQFWQMEKNKTSDKSNAVDGLS